MRGWDEGIDGLARRRRSAVAYARHLRSNPNFADTVLLVQRDWGAFLSHTLVGERLLAPGAAICWYRTNKRLDGKPGRTWHEGLSHTAGALSDSVNAAALLGWKTIVLVGVDLYDSRYFWGPADGTLDFDADGEFIAATARNDHAISWDGVHNTARNGIVETLQAWREAFEADRVRLEVYNPRSLLTRVLPVYDAPGRRT
jgi:hypothetical protein